MWVSSHLTGMCLYDFICITHTHNFVTFEVKFQVVVKLFLFQ